MSNATTVTLYTETLRDCVCAQISDNDAFDDALPGYIDRVRAYLPDGVTLEVNEYDLSTASLRDDVDQSLAQEIEQAVEFWM